MGDELPERSCLSLNKLSIPWISNHIDRFVSQSKNNKKTIAADFYPYALKGQDDKVWDKVGKAIGNLQELKTIHISPDHEDDDGADVLIPDWGKLAHILSYMRQKISVNLETIDPWAVREVQALAIAIRGHPMITSFDISGLENSGTFPNESLDTLYSALTTLPALESITLGLSITLGAPEVRQAHANSESLTELLRLPTLRSVYFDQFHFTRALCQATANALVEGTAITKLKFSECTFSAIEYATILANGFSRNTSVTCIEVCDDNVPALPDALAAALPSNSTLRDLSFTSDDDDAYVDWSNIFAAVGKNTGLKTLKLDVTYSMDESLCTAMQNGLAMNETLENLELADVPLCDDNADLWCRAFSFLRTNKALKSLIIRLNHVTEESCVSAFRINIAAMLQETASLESITIVSWESLENEAEEYLVLITKLQHNPTLKSLDLKNHGCLTLTHDEDKQMAALLQKNYALESLPHLYLKNGAGDVGAILRLNKAGRRYLIEDGASISKGVKVLSAVSNEINCVFLHLLENPTLCDRSAVETAVADSTCADNSGSTSSIGKREHGQQAQTECTEGKESRRRLT
jgi:hypothetical protein